MKPKTMILMVVAVTCGLGASYMTSKLLAERNNAPKEVETVPVLVAKTRISGWQPIKEPEKVFEIKMFPVDVAPKRAISKLEDVKDQRLNKPLDESKPLTQDDLLTKDQQSVADQLLPGQRAIAIKVTTESLAGGFVLPGTRVDVICTTRGNEASAKIVLQNMLVLAVDTQSDRNPEQKTIIGQTVTLAATPEEATRLALAGSIGDLRLTIKNQGDTGRASHVVVRAADLNKPISAGLGGEQDADLVAPKPVVSTPLPVLPKDDKPEAKPEEPVVVAPPKPKKRHVMTIVNGSQREKAHFVEGEEEEESSSSSSSAAPKEVKKAEPQAKKEQPKAGSKPVGK